MDFIRTSLKVSAAALLTAPVLLIPLTSTGHYGSLAHRLASYRLPMIPTDSLDRAMQGVAAQFGPSTEAAATVLASLSPTLPASEKPAEAAPASMLSPMATETTLPALAAPRPADALSAIALLGKSEGEVEMPAQATAYAPQPELQAASSQPDPATQLGINMVGLREAIAFYKNGELAAGDRVGANAPDALVRTTLEWVALRTNQRGTGFKRVMAFLETHPGSP